MNSLKCHSEVRQVLEDVVPILRVALKERVDIIYDSSVTSDFIDGFEIILHFMGWAVLANVYFLRCRDIQEDDSSSKCVIKVPIFCTNRVEHRIGSLSVPIYIS